MQTIIPAILETDLFEIKRKFDLVKDECELVQIDLCDGVFVESKTWPFEENNPYSELANLYNDAKNIQLDVMVQDPKVEDILSVPFAYIVFHASSLSKEMLDLFILSDKTKRESVIGFAFSSDFGSGDRPDSVFENYHELISKCDFVQVMGIKNIGKQREPFDATCCETIEKIRAEFPDVIIQVDGGMNEETIPLVFAAGANKAIVGSAIFGKGNAVENLKKLQSLV